MVYIGRPNRRLGIAEGPFGNPSELPRNHTDEQRQKCVANHREYMMHADQTALRERVRRECRGKQLVCFCKPKACHGDLLAIIAETADDSELQRVLSAQRSSNPNMPQKRKDAPVTDFFRAFKIPKTEAKADVKDVGVRLHAAQDGTKSVRIVLPMIKADMTKQGYGPETLILQQNNCLSVNAKGLADTLAKTYPYSAVYARRKLDPHRGYGLCTMDTESREATVEFCHDPYRVGPTIACMYAQRYPGTASKVVQRQDTEEMRHEWFAACLERVRHDLVEASVVDVARIAGCICETVPALTNPLAQLVVGYIATPARAQLLCTLGRITRVVIPANIGCGLAQGNPDKYKSMVREFCRQVLHEIPRVHVTLIDWP